MSDTTIIYLTDNSLDVALEVACQRLLLNAAQGRRIVSVSQRPMGFGDNVCVGDIGRSGLSMDRQMMAGLVEAKARWVAIAEHDCVYSAEHFDWTPTNDEHFFYNDNCWLVQLKNEKHPDMDGLYSFIRGRRVQSQLICSREALVEATQRKIDLLSSEAWQTRHPVRPIGEPGSADYAKGRQLVNRPSMRHLWAQLKDYLTRYAAVDFSTTVPNIDIRHGHNFTGPRRGKNRTWDLEPWGKIGDVLCLP